MEKFDSYLLDYGILNKNLVFKSNLAISISLPFLTGSYNFPNQDLTLDLATKEIQQSFERTVSQSFYDQNEDYIDVINLTEKYASLKLLDYLKINDFDFVIFSGALNADITNTIWDNGFGYKPSSGEYRGAQLYKTGTVRTYGRSIDLYVDPFKKYNDKSILCGKKDGFQYNVEIDTILPKPVPPDHLHFDPFSFTGKIQILLRYNIDMLKQFTTLYWINEKDYAYDKFKSHLIKENRDLKIDEILK